MKFLELRFVPLLAGAIAVAMSVQTTVKADEALPGAMYSTDAVVTPGTVGNEFWIYEESTPGNLVLTNDAGQLHAVLRGHAGAPGGNLELFAWSELPGYVDASSGGAFATVVPVTLSGVAGAFAFEFRRLNGTGWFGSTSGHDTTYGASTLATEWFDGFMDHVAALSGGFVAAVLNANRGGLFDDWRDAGGFASLSDPNIGYVYQDGVGGNLRFGLEGFLDASPRFQQFLTDAGYGAVAGFVPAGIQYSEVVMLNGAAFYSFGNATSSGVALNDPFQSYTGTFAFVSSVPEPGGALLIGTIGVFLLLCRRKFP
ncbi:PEP-CTERM sorting domain-containing protein [Phragmitibacter flavus]|uniref:PEP-CTERM sorting domain-containing protein n=1 Tax=Phragmitibacter flavus TaxID=2576071 RepID=A0A5R8KJN0_9BACT|nr:NF038130 family PEP-CTERM protein [Phragmitibacter flavus]TLD72145.1 PEP-CTERM sorting domain-containing protein [Phragmitibacter flavus]